MSNYVYVLGSSGNIGSARGRALKPPDHKTYVGWTTDLERRLGEHNAGTGARSTRGRQWVLLYAERYDTQREAMSREWHLKRDRVLRKQLREIII